MSEIVLDNAAIKAVFVDVYDTYFSLYDPDIRSSYEEYLDESLASGLLDAERETLSSGAVYTNWNFHVLNGYGPTLATTIPSDDEDERAISSALVALKTLRIFAIVGDGVRHAMETKEGARVKQFYTNLSEDARFAFGSVELEAVKDLYKKNGFTELKTYHMEFLKSEKTKVLNDLDALNKNKSNYSDADYEVARHSLLSKKQLVENESFSDAKFSSHKNTVQKAAYTGANALSTGTHVLTTAIAEALKDPSAPVESHISTGSYIFSSFTEGLGYLADGMGHTNAGKLGAGLGAGSLIAAGGAAFSSLVRLLESDSLTSEQRKIVVAEMSLQGTALGLGAIEGVLGIASKFVAHGSKAANIITKAAPVIGALGSIIGAINPMQWSEFSSKEDQIRAIRKSDTYSSNLLADLLGESLTIEKAFYGSSTAIGGVTGIASSALALTGVGAPIAAVVGLIGGAIALIVQAFEQVALEDKADEYRKKMMVDSEGNQQSIDQYFEGSFDYQQLKARERYQDYFDELLQRSDFEHVQTLGSQQLTATDVMLAGITKTAGYDSFLANHMGYTPEGAALAEKQYRFGTLNKSAKHYFETYRGNGNWDEQSIKLEVAPGADRILLPDSYGAESYLTFISPLFASGEEWRSRKSTGKYDYQTTLKIVDVHGWIVEDFGDNATTFNLDKVVAKAEGQKGHKTQIPFHVEAKGGDDTLFAYDAGVTFNGGAGLDTASYVRLDKQDLVSGVHIVATGPNTLTVTKKLAAGSKFYDESIHTKTVNYGKRAEYIEYRGVSLTSNQQQTNRYDTLYNVEILHGGERGDIIDVSNSNQVLAIYGFDGNDLLIGGESVQMVSGGMGDDVITFTDDVLMKMFNATKTEDLVLIDGGEGDDKLRISETVTSFLSDYYETWALQQDLGRFMATSLLPTNLENGAAEISSLAESFAKILANGSDEPKLNPLFLNNIERIAFELKDSKPGADTDEMRIYSLLDYAKMANFVARSTTDEGASINLGVSVSAKPVDGSVALVSGDSGDALEGSVYDDVLLGNGGDDILQGGAGNDLLGGGPGTDSYIFDSADKGHDLITGAVSADLLDDEIIINTGSDGVEGFFRFQKDLVVQLSDDSSVTVADFFSKYDGSTLDNSGTQTLSTNNGISSNMTRLIGDVNGDGLADVVVNEANETTVMLGQADGTFAAKKQASASFGSAGPWGADEKYPRYLADVNGDGRDDFVGVGSTMVVVELGQVDGTFVRSIGTQSFGYNDVAGGYDRFPRMLADVNGDGRSDIVSFEWKNTKVALGQENGAFSAPVVASEMRVGHFGNDRNNDQTAIYDTWLEDAGKWQYGWSTQDRFPRMLGDVNGDGKADIVGFGGGVFVALGQDDGTFSPMKLRIKEGFDHLEGQNKYPRFLADVNGDEKDDIVFFRKSDTVVALGREDGSFTKPYTVAVPTYYDNGWTSQTQFPRRLADVNGDGKADIVAFGESSTLVYFGQENGEFLDAEQLDGDAAPVIRDFSDASADWSKPSGPQTRFLADVNGDGKADIVGVGNGTTQVALSDENSRFYPVADTNLFDLKTITINSGDLTEVSTAAKIGTYAALNEFDYNSAFASNYVAFRASGKAWTGNSLQLKPGALTGNEISGGLQEVRDSIGLVIGTDQSETLLGDTKSNTVLGYAGDDQILGLSGNDNLFGHDGDDTLNGGDDNDSLSGGNGNDMLIGEAGNDSLAGDNGDDTLLGGVGDDILHGGLGVNSLSGGDGDDILASNRNDSSVDGGEGLDIVDKMGSQSRIKIDLNSSDKVHYWLNNKWEEGETFTSIEGAITGAYDDSLFGTAEGNKFYGESGDDWIEGRQGDDTISGGSGADSIYGDQGNDILSGGRGDDEIYGLSGDDILIGGAGSDTLRGGEGYDIVSFENSAVSAYVMLTKTEQSHFTLDGTRGAPVWKDDIGGFEGFIGSDYDDVFEGDMAINYIEGGAGDDRIDGGGGADVIVIRPGHGNDIIQNFDFIAAAGGVIKFVGFDNITNIQDIFANVKEYTGGNMLSTTITTGPNDSIQLQKIPLSYLHAGLFVFTTDLDYTKPLMPMADQAGVNLTGTVGNDTLVGSDGDDTIFGGDGNDVIEAGLGNDELDGGNGFDILSYKGQNAAVHVNLGDIQTQYDVGEFNAPVQGDKIQGFEGLIGSDSSDRLSGDWDGGSYIEGRGGNDKAFLFGGNNLIVYREGDGQDQLSGIDPTSDIIRFVGVASMTSYGDVITNSDSGVISISPSDKIDLGISQENLNVDMFEFYSDDETEIVNLPPVDSAGYDSDAVMGTTGNDQMNLTASADIADGLEGNDTIVALGGEDTIYGGSGNDSLNGGSQNDVINGGSGDDVLHGELGDDVIYGRDGADTIYGGAGDDLISGGGGRDVLRGGAGYDTLSFAGSTSKVHVDLTPGFGVGGRGSQLLRTDGVNPFEDGQIFEFEGVVGSDASDRLHAGHWGNNYIEGGRGNDDLYSSTNGNNVFVFKPGHGNDTVYGVNRSWDKVDTIRFEGIEGFSSYADMIANTHQDKTIMTSAEDSVVIRFAQISFLPEDMFEFA